MQPIFKFIFTPYIFALLTALFSAAALIMALIAQYGFDLEPCILCIYQRFPFAINVLLGLTAYKLASKNYPRGCGLIITLMGIVFLFNSGLAFYHTGVEQHWWVSAFEGCKIDPTNIREAALNPPVPCDQIPWQMYGISMAGYNVIICGIAGIICTLFGIREYKAH